MTSLFTAHRRAEDFADAVEHPDSADALAAALLGVVFQLRSAALGDDARPSADFSRTLRERLMAEADVALAPADEKLVLHRPETRHPRRLAAAASALVLVGGGASLAAASQGALPGEALYPVKRGVEQLEFVLDSGPASGADLLTQARTRLVEVDALIKRGDPADDGLVTDTLASFNEQASEGSQILLDDYQATDRERSAAAVRVFAADSLAQINALLTEVPDEDQSALADAAAVLVDLDQQAADLCPACGGDVLALPADLLANAAAAQALAETEASSLPLDNSHPVVLDAQAAAAATALRDAAAAAPGSGGDRSGSSSKDGSASGVAGTDTPAPSSPSTPSTPQAPSTGGGGGAGQDAQDTVEHVTHTVKDTTDAAAGGAAADMSGSVETIVPDPVKTPVKDATDAVKGTVDKTTHDATDATDNLLN